MIREIQRALWIGLATISLADADPRKDLLAGTQALEQGQFTNAATLFSQAAQAAPAAGLDPAIAHFNRGVALYRDQQWDAACAAFNTARQTAHLPTQALALYNAAACRLQQGDAAWAAGQGALVEPYLNDALDWLGQSLALNPDQPDARYNLECAWARKAAWLAAMQELTAALQTADRLISAHQFPEALQALKATKERLVPALVPGIPQTKSFEQMLERTGQIVQILEHPESSSTP